MKDAPLMEPEADDKLKLSQNNLFTHKLHILDCELQSFSLTNPEAKHAVLQANRVAST